MQLANKLQTAKLVSFSLFMAFTTSSTVLAGGSVGVAGFVLPDGTVIEGLEIGSADFVNALYELRAGSNYHFQAPDTNVTINRFNLIQGVPVLEGISDDQQKFLMLENSMVENNFIKIDDQEIATYYIRPDFRESTKLNPGRLVVDNEVLFEMSNFTGANDTSIHKWQSNVTENKILVEIKNCNPNLWGETFISTSNSENSTILYSDNETNFDESRYDSAEAIGKIQTTPFKLTGSQKNFISSNFTFRKFVCR